MLRVDERVDLVVAQRAEQLAQMLPVVVTRLRLLEHPRAVARREGGLLLVAPDRGERRAMPVREQLVVPRELDECVVPVEEDGFEHGG